LRGSRLIILLITVMLGLSISNSAQASKYADTVTIFKKSEVVQSFLKNAYGYAVFPIVGKGGIGIGGAYGKGQVYRGGKVTGEVKFENRKRWTHCIRVASNVVDLEASENP